MVQLHHAGLCPADLAASLRFYVEGIGLDVLFDVTLPADLEPLLGERTERVRTVFLGSSDHPDGGLLELLDLGTGRAQLEDPAPGLPTRGLTLLSFQTPVEPALARLAVLGLGGVPRRMSAGDNLAATVVDPDGVLVELIDQPMRVGRPRA